MTEKKNEEQAAADAAEEGSSSETVEAVEEELETASELEELEAEIMKLEEEVEVELETEVGLIEERLNKLKEGLTAAQQFEEQIGELEEELAAEKEEKEKYVNRLQRLQADFSNYKKRIEKEKKRANQQAIKELVEDLLPIIDNFERALNTSQDSEEAADVLKGVEMIYKQLVDLLHKKGVEEIATVGEEFDPNFHEAAMTEESEEYESGVIIEEMQPGYKLDNLVIRPAMVKIAE